MAGKPIGSFYVGLGLDTKEFQRKIRAAERDLQNAFGSAAIRTSQMLAGSMAVAAGAVGYLGAQSVKLAADLEVQAKAFERLLGSSAAAKDKLEELQTFAAATPFTFTEVTAATKKLLALGFAADEVISVLTSVGDAASGLGLDSGGMDRIIKAFGDIRSKGVLATQEIKQLAENGIPAFEILAQNLGVTIPEAMKLVEDRAVDSQTAVNAFMTGINQRFGGMMAIQSKTMLGMWSTIVDEAENSMRVVGAQITQSAGLKSAIQQVRDAAISFRHDLENRGFMNAFSNILGEKATAAVIVTAGAIAGSLTPAIIAAGLAVKGALIPLLPVIGMGAVIAAGGYAAYKAWDKFGAAIKGSVASLPEILKSIYYLGAATIEKLASLAARMMASVFNSLFSYASNSSNQITQSLAPLFSDIALWSAQTAANMQKQSAESVALAASYGDLAGKIQEIYQTEKAIADFSDWSGIENFNQLWERGESTVGRIAATIRTMANPLTSLFANITGQGKNATTKTGGAPTPGKSSGQSEAEKLTEEAKRTSESIIQSYTSQVLGKRAMLDLEYQKERENLDRSKAYNKNYRRDLFILDEVFYQRRIELAREAQEAEAKLQAELGVSRADYVREQMEAEAQLEESKLERRLAEIDGSALEAQLSADRQAADLEAYIQHLNEKSAADRAYLEGRRNLIEVYDQLQRDANRTNADFMAESYRTVYYGLTDALTGIVTGAKNAGEAFKELGMQIIQMVVKWQIQKRLAAVMSKSLEASSTAASIAMAAATAAAWAPAAAMVAAATFGASTAAGAAGLTSLNALSRALAIPGLASGGIVTKPTLAMIGEGNESEAVIPLSKLGEMGGAANVQVNVINQTGTPVNARTSQRTDGGKVVVDLFLEGYSRNVSGIQDIIGRRS